jgi:hypothetical protein
MPRTNRSWSAAPWAFAINFGASHLPLGRPDFLSMAQQAAVVFEGVGKDYRMGDSVIHALDGVSSRLRSRHAEPAGAMT